MPDGPKMRWVRTALVNLDQAAAYIAADNPRAATAAVQRIRTAAENLAIYPNLGRAGRVEGTHEPVISGTPFLVAYRVKGGSDEILRLLHGAERRPDDRNDN